MNLALAALVATCAPAVHPTTMLALIAVESAGNPYAVSVNHPAALRAAGIAVPEYAQPRSLPEARARLAALSARGYSSSVGLAQINAERLGTWRLAPEALLDPCVNVALAQRVLLECEAALRGPRRSTASLLSCFNSGDATTGIANGYAARVMRAAIHLRSSSIVTE